MKTYKILSVAFIVICTLLLIGLSIMPDFPVGRKIIFAACLCVVIALMATNMVVMSKKNNKE